PDAVAAYNLIAAHNAPDGPPATPSPNPQVAVNVQQNTSLTVNFGGFVAQHVQKLLPGQPAGILFNVPVGTGRVVVDVKNITSTLTEPQQTQNQVFGDGLSVDIHSAKTSAIRGTGDYLANALPRALPQQQNAHFEFTNLDTGILRVTITGDPANS